MVKIEINEKSCRGCKMCVDVCPTEVFTFDEGDKKAKSNVSEDCFACLSCSYICPSLAIKHSDYHSVKNFYRDIEFSKRVEKFL